MSETLRSLPPKGVQRPGVRRSRIWRWSRQALLLILLIMLVHGVWVTRDTTPFTRLIPADQQYGLFLSDIMIRRERLAQSFIWRAAPELTGGAAALLQAEPPLPEWVLHNLVSSTCYLSGNDLDTFDDVLILTRMSHVGAVLERYARLGPWSERDPAGGLNLRRLRDADLYYAVRGRTLALSPSRDSLIRALTLRPEDMVNEEHYEAATERSGLEDVGGVVVLNPGDPMGDWVHTIGFAARAEPGVVEARGRISLTQETEAWAPMLDGLNAAPLLAPPPGMAGLSLNINMPLDEFLVQAAAMGGWDWPPAWLTADVENEDGENTAPAFAWAADLTAPLGPSVALGIVGFDPYDITPMPILALITQTAGDPEAVLDLAPAPPEGAMPWESYPRRDPDRPLVYIPAIGGPSLEPALTAVDNHLLAVSSRAAAETLVEQQGLVDYLERQGNLFLRLEPVPLVEVIVETGRQLVEADMLDGHTPASFNALAEDWLDRAREADHAELLLAREGREILVELRIASPQWTGAEGPGELTSF